MGRLALSGGAVCSPYDRLSLVCSKPLWSAILIVETYMIAVINLALTIIVSHVRLALYDDRFLTLTYLFALVSVMLVLFLMFELVARHFHLNAYARPALL